MLPEVAVQSGFVGLIDHMQVLCAGGSRDIDFVVRC